MLCRFPIGLQEELIFGARHLSQRTIIARTKTQKGPAIY